LENVKGVVMDLKDLFSASFRVREKGGTREFSAIKMTDKFQFALPDFHGYQDVERVVEDKSEVYDPVSGRMKGVVTPRVVKDRSKVFNPEEGHYHGGNVRGNAGDYLVTDGQMFFVVRAKNEQGGPVFDVLYTRL
jgi:hypothetical protein